MCSAIARLDVAPGDGAFRTVVTVPMRPIRKSSTSEPSGSSAWARTPADEDKLGPALHRLVEEDPGIRVERVEETHQTLLRGVGEAHVALALERLQDKYGVGIDTEEVAIAYRETIGGRAEAEGRHKKQTGGHGQFAVCSLVVEPLHNRQPADTGQKRATIDVHRALRMVLPQTKTGFPSHERNPVVNLSPDSGPRGLPPLGRFRRLRERLLEDLHRLLRRPGGSVCALCSKNIPESGVQDGRGGGRSTVGMQCLARVRMEAKPPEEQVVFGPIDQCA